jgi:uncharacterized Zn finger protein
MRYGDWPPYVSVAERRARALLEVAGLARKTGKPPAPVRIEGREIARTFWGKAWCDNLERYSDFASRLPRGRSYVRNGSVVDLRIEPGAVRARVAGTELYSVDVTIKPLAKPRWRELKRACTGKIGSLVALLRGKLSDEVLELLVHPGQGLFPEPHDLDMDCSCPDWAGMCKHIAATLYGVGARLDREPALFFVLRELEQAELLSAATEIKAPSGRKKKEIAADQLGAVFGIELDAAPERRKKRR